MTFPPLPSLRGDPILAISAGKIGFRTADGGDFLTRSEAHRCHDVSEEFNVEESWPELFAPLDKIQRRAVVQSLASAWHEGWTPNRRDVENLTDRARGAIDRAEYRRRSHDR
ncbi:hypothetical protein [Rhodococcus sp. T7]|uniref:antitoxin VbhA family protein n=1 Tax=Rhodococcus sp. T7 TaxID=627444 RepID=UPI0022A8599C|nr:hypothetical protein [Rhodococcus sp. T7]